MKKASLTEVFNSNGGMSKIIATDAETGEHIIDALWDPHDQQTEENRYEFRKWVNTMLARKGFISIN